MSSSVMSSRRLPPRYAAFLTPLVLSILMSLIVSGVSTLRSLGFSPDYFSVWPMAWLLSWVVAFPTLLMVMPLVRRIVGLVVQPAPR